MPIYELPSEPIFPDPNLADKNGLLAYGGDLSPRRLVVAYQSGFFPWFEEGSPDILWWTPDPRMVLFPDKFKLSKSLRQKIRRQTFEIRVDSAFEQVIKACRAVPRPGQDGTWITDEIELAYTRLHRLGIAHSVECWQDGQLVGGLYGLSLGKIFFGESMFHKVSDASKVAFYYLSYFCKQLEFSFIDCQMHTDHLQRLGAEEMPRSAYLKSIYVNNELETMKGSWEELVEVFPNSIADLFSGR